LKLTLLRYGVKNIFIYPVTIKLLTSGPPTVNRHRFLCQEAARLTPSVSDPNFTSSLHPLLISPPKLRVAPFLRPPVPPPNFPTRRGSTGDNRWCAASATSGYTRFSHQLHSLHDNTRIHTSTPTWEWFAQQPQFIFLPWPACSPDLNPIGHVWDFRAAE